MTPRLATDTRDRILEAAMDLFRARSFNGVGTDEICRAAGVNKGSLYHHFPSKVDLAVAVIDRWMERMKDEIITRAYQPQFPPLERIRRHFQAVVCSQECCQEQHGCVCGCPFGNFAGELATVEEPVRQRVRAIFEEMTGHIEQALREAMEAGEIPPRDPHMQALLLMSVLEGAALMAKTTNDPKMLGRLCEEALDQIKRN